FKCAVKAVLFCFHRASARVTVLGWSGRSGPRPARPLTDSGLQPHSESGVAMRAFEYVTPTKKEQVAALLGEQGSILAGGTDLLALMKDDVVAPKRLVNIKQIEALRGTSYQPGNGLRIGALTTLAELAEAKAELAAYPMLVEVLGEAASPQI